MERRPFDDPATVAEARPAATIVLVRPGPAGLEVLLTRRPDSMAFAAGLHVFPGGRVDPADTAPELVARARAGPRDAPDGDLGHRIAAIRETWEEVGVLLADRRGSPLARVSGPAGHRPGDHAEPDGFRRLVADLDLELRADALVEVARWTTPRAYPRRFAARFFVAELPPGSELRPDPVEVAGLTWLTPRAALAEMAAGRIAMWPPTSTTLQRLERARSFDQIRAGLALRPEPPIRVEPIGPGLTLVTGRHAFGPTGRPANTILVGTGEVVVIDPGDPGEATLDAIEAAVAAAGGRIAAIALTHVDPGHAAGSEELRSRTGAPILCGPGGAAVLSWAATEIDEAATLPGADDRSGSPGLRVLRTPGHRPDHLSFLLADGTLVAGDVIVDGPPLVLPPEGDPAAQASSLARLADLVAQGRIRRVIPGHGRPVDAGAVPALRPR
jgi:glyoxylase-like metal-dependent hydrolase (beta-lactamase superfamily II)/8-oxo-dGTP pyrophosphatase MutT (NUDIX family)